MKRCRSCPGGCSGAAGVVETRGGGPSTAGRRRLGEGLDMDANVIIGPESVLRTTSRVDTGEAPRAAASFNPSLQPTADAVAELSRSGGEA